MSDSVERTNMYMYKFSRGTRVMYNESGTAIMEVESSDIGVLKVGKNNIVRLSLIGKTIIIHTKIGSKLIIGDDHET